MCSAKLTVAMQRLRCRQTTCICYHISVRARFHSSITSSLKGHDVPNAKLWYLKPLDLYRTVKPYHINLPANALPPGVQSNEESEEYRDIAIRNIRGAESKFALDRNGFQVFSAAESDHSPSAQVRGVYKALKEEEYNDPNTVRKKYYPAIEAFLKAALGAERALAFTHDVRRREPQFPSLPRGTGKAPQPVQGVHVDFTPRWAKQRLHMLFPEAEVEEILNRRWQVLNVWRPLFGPLQDWPLGLCDYSSIDPQSDLVPSDNVYTHLVTETYNMLHRDSHLWYYLEGMKSDELLVFKSYDSKAVKGTARVCPHAAFENPLTPYGARLRESIECLVYVLYPEGDDNVIEAEAEVVS